MFKKQTLEKSLAEGEKQAVFKIKTHTDVETRVTAKENRQPTVIFTKSSSLK